ncbi:MAG: hypothetical protein J1F09_06395 [Oscillospiraceae bacterium]|nr:hypothetical protein [Oscillospiraceae bacterium]
MFSMNDKVRILKNDLIGTVVDISEEDGETRYIVESDTPFSEGGYGGKWKLFDCCGEELARVDDSKTEKVRKIS